MFFNWFGNARRVVSSANTQDKDELRWIQKLQYFEESMLRLLLLIGHVDVVVVPSDNGNEKIVACTMWTEPGVVVEPTGLQIFRLRLSRVLRSYGFGILKVCMYLRVPDRPSSYSVCSNTIMFRKFSLILTLRT